MKFLVILIILILTLVVCSSKDVLSAVINRIRLFFSYALNALKFIIRYTLLIFWYIFFYGLLTAVFIQICETKSILTRIGWSILFLIDMIAELIFWIIDKF